ncbi:MAG TPA: hypothetical protein VF701_04615 [Thermoanaerobaculia bacterium]
MAKNETKTKRERGRKEKSAAQSEDNGKSTMRNVAAAAPSADALIELVQNLGVVDLVAERLRSRIEEIELDELLDDATGYLKRKPEVLVVGLGAATVAAAMLVWMNNRRESAGSQRSNYASSSGKMTVIDEEEVEQIDSKPRRDRAPRARTTNRSRRASA